MTRNEKLFQGYLKKWIKKLGLSDWDISIKFSNQEDYCKENNIDDPEWSMCLVIPFWQYQLAHIRVNKDQVNIEDEDNLEENAIHELVHCMVNEMESYSKDEMHEEHVVSMLARAIKRIDRQ